MGTAAATVLVDGNNVIGARPDGWWRDRAGAAARLLGRLQCLAASGGPVIEVVFDVAPRGTDDGVHDGVRVHSATRRGRDAADDRIVELVAARTTPDVEVVTSDRGLASRVREHGVAVTGASSFLARLEARGC